MQKQTIKEYKGSITSCSCCGKPFEEGKIITSGREGTEEKKEVAFCGMLCMAKYAEKRKVAIIVEPILFTGK